MFSRLDSIKRIIVRPEDAIGDTIITTRLLNSLVKNPELSDIQIVASVDGFKKDLLEGILIENGGFSDGLEREGIVGIIDRDYIPRETEFLLDFSGYLDENQALKGENYSESMIRIAEEKLSAKGLEVSLNRNVSTELRFDNVPRFEDYVGAGKEKVAEIRSNYGDKPIIWLGTRTAGSKNRMPQSYNPKENFWQELVDKLEDKYVLFELRGPGENPIAEGPSFEPPESESYHFAASSEIIKASAAGVGLDGMHVELAHGSGNKKMVILVGPTHPKTMIYPGSENEMLTVPSVEEFEAGNYCRGCGQVGYSTAESFEEKKRAMNERFPGFEFDWGTQRALGSDEIEYWNDVVGCRTAPGKPLYDCWDKVSVDNVIERLEVLLPY